MDRRSVGPALDAGWLEDRLPLWADRGWWWRRIDDAVSDPDPRLANLKITLTHRELSQALHHITGPRSGANFHTWAVWGSKKAGRTIRRQDVPGLPALAGVVGACLGLVAARAMRGRRRWWLLGSPVGAALLRGCACATLDRAATQIFGGNATVLDDIGRQSARFVCEFLDPERRTDAQLERFVGELREGPATDGGQALLRAAYRHYLRASREPDGDHRDELMLCANLLAILHEHYRLDPYIDASMPRPLRRLVTRYLLNFSMGVEALRVSRDIPMPGKTAFPETLRTIELPELDALLGGPEGWDRTPQSISGSAARDWSELPDRMNFIVDLFRTRQFDEGLFENPYSADQQAMIAAGRVPDGPL